MSNNFNFKQSALDAIAASPVMSGREKIEPDEIRNQELTLDEIGWYEADKKDDNGKPISDDNGEVIQETRVVAHFVEYPNNYVNVGKLFHKIAKAWAAAFDGDIEAASDELKSQGGVRVKITMKKASSGNRFNNVEFL